MSRTLVIQGASIDQDLRSRSQAASSSAQADTARNTSRKRPAAAQSSYPTVPQPGPEASSSSSSRMPAEEQEEHQFFKHRVPAAPMAASYGPTEQAEAKRQANKEAALTWLDKAKAAAASKEWAAAVGVPPLLRCNCTWIQ